MLDLVPDRRHHQQRLAGTERGHGQLGFVRPVGLGAGEQHVPNGDATEKINFRITHLVNGNPRSVTYRLDENPITGFTKIYTGSDIIAIGFGDNNGSQTYPAKLGSGVGPDHSLEQTC